MTGVFGIETIDAKVDKEKLRGNIEQRLEQVEPEKLQNIQRRDELEASLVEVTRLNEELERVKQTLEQDQIEYGEIESSLCEILNLERDELTPENIKSFLKGLESQIAELEQSLESEQEYHRNWERKIERAREETRFHRYRSKKESFETHLEIGLKPVEERLNELAEFRGSLEEIRQVLSSELKEVLRRALPPINKMMTEVYKHLTNQVSFGQVQIELEEQNGDFSPKLLVHVASSDEPDLPPLDPAANHAQLVVATHEEDCINPLLPDFFKKDEVSIIRVPEFDKKGGPHIEMG